MSNASLSEVLNELSKKLKLRSRTIDGTTVIEREE